MRTCWIVLLVSLFGCSSSYGRPADYSPVDLWTPPPREPAPPPESSAALPAVLNVQTAVEFALSENPGLKAAFMRVEAARARLAASKSFYYPTLDGQAGYLRTFKVPEDRSFGGFTAENTGFNTIGLRAAWILFDGLSREYRVKAARLGVEESRAMNDDARRLLRQAVEGAFFDALGAAENVRIADADLTFEKELLEETSKRYDAGDRSLSDRLNFEVRVQTAITRLTTAQSLLRTLKFVLAELLNLKAGAFPDTIRLASLEEEAPALLACPDVEALVKEGLRNRPDLGAARVAVERGEAEVGVADGSWWPTVSLVGEIGRQRYGSAHYEPRDVGSSISLDATWNLFSGGASLAAHREALANQKAAGSTLAQVRNRIVSEVRQAVEAVVTAQKQIAAQRERLQLTRQTRNLVRKEYDAGSATLVRLNEAQHDFVVTEAQMAAERVNLRIAWSGLRAAAACYD